MLDDRGARKVRRMRELVADDTTNTVYIGIGKSVVGSLMAEYQTENRHQNTDEYRSGAG